MAHHFLRLVHALTWIKAQYFQPMKCHDALRWCTSNYTEGQDCIQVADLIDLRAVGIRDSKDPDSPMLTLTPTSWTALIANVTGNQLNGA